MIATAGRKQGIWARGSEQSRPSHQAALAKDVYLELVKKAAEALIAERYLLPADLEAIAARAAQRYDLRMEKKLEVP